MFKKILIALTLSLLVLLGTYAVQPAAGRNRGGGLSQKTSAAPTGTLQKMIVESGSVTIDLDLNGFNGNSSLVARLVTLQFTVGANSFFPILVFNDLLRGPEPGSMTLIPAGVIAPGYTLPGTLGASLEQLVIEKLPSDRGFDLAVRDGNTGFTFFNVEGHQYDYDANARALSITNGRLLVSKEFANALGRPSDAGAIVGKISVGAAMQPVEIDQLVNGQPQSAVMPGVGTVPGPDVIVGDLIGLEQSDSGSVGGRVGLALRAWVNPFTGNFPVNPDPNDHSGHSHDATSHRMLVDVNDLSTSLNPGATYFAEANYIVPDEGIWCQAHPMECNMYNNASYRQYSVIGINQPFSFQSIGATVREQPAIKAWTGATVSDPIQPAPGTDGIWFIGYKVTNPSAGIWHYEYALYNQNLDRAIQSFSVPLGPGVNVSNIEFHAPIQQPGWPHDGTQGDAGYSPTPWDVDTTNPDFITWSTQTFATNQNANAIRFGTLYN